MQYTRTGVTEVYPTPATTNTCSTHNLIHAAHQDRSYRSISYSSHNKYMQHTRTGITEVYPTPDNKYMLQKYILL